MSWVSIIVKVRCEGRHVGAGLTDAVDEVNVSNGIRGEVGCLVGADVWERGV
jgi:hypothetical protein